MKFNATAKAALLECANAAFADCAKANTAEPYDHQEYERNLGMARASLVLYFDGDVAKAYALVQCYHDSNEDMEYYLENFDIEELVQDYPLPGEGTYAHVTLGRTI